MLNMLDTQDNLKNFSEDQLVREMQAPSGSAPQFMVLGEIERRKRMRADSQRQQGLMQPTVAQEAIAAAGVPQQGIAGVAQSLAPQTDMTQNTGVPNVQAAGLPGQPNQPQRMADGGVLKLAPGGALVTDPEIIAAASQSNMTVDEYISRLSPEIIAQRLALLNSRDPSPTEIADQMKDLVPGGTSGQGYQLYDYTSPTAVETSLRPSDRPDTLDTSGGPTSPRPRARPDNLDARVDSGVGGIALMTDERRAAEERRREDESFARQDEELDYERRNRIPVMSQTVTDLEIPAGGIRALLPTSDPTTSLRPRARSFAPIGTVGFQDLESRPDVRAVLDVVDDGPQGYRPTQMGATELNSPKVLEALNSDVIDRFEHIKNRLSANGNGATEPDYADRFDPEAGFIPAYPGDVPPSVKARNERVDTLPEVVDILPDEVSPVTNTSSGGTSSGGTSSGGTSDDEAPASGSSMDQDKWLALAHAGFALMSTGDIGKAGQAGLAAYSQSKQDAQDARKLEAELDFLDARTRATNRPSGGGGGARAAIGDINYLQERVDVLSAELASGEFDPEPGYFGSSIGASDPAAAARMRKENELGTAKVQLQIALASRGFPTSAASTSVPSIKTPSATQ
tara:strand:+ start:93 stop:1970 length:1878 start_codon:yes stop_codon:yes gene_type:complete